MIRVISQRELRHQSGDIMRGLDRGERFVPTRNGVPVGELSPLRRHRFISTEFALGVLRGAPRVDFEAFRADVDEVADPNAEPRA